MLLSLIGAVATLIAMEPLLVIDDIVAMDRRLILLPAILREGLPIVVGDSVDLCSDEGRFEVVVHAIEPDPRDPRKVRLHIAPTIRAVRGVEVWPSESTSRVVLKRPADCDRRVTAHEVVRLSGAISPRTRR
jgi:hypothetical protein